VRKIVCIRNCDAGLLGPENLVLSLGEALQPRGVQLILVNLWDGTPPCVALHEEAVRRGIESYVLRLAWGTDPSLFPRLRALLCRFRPDVVLTHDPKSEVAAVVATRFMPTPLVGAYYGRLAVRSRWLKLHEATSPLSFRFYSRVLANSMEQRRDLLQRGVQAEKVVVLPSTTDTRRLVPPSPGEVRAARDALGITPDQAVLATVARLSLQKGHTFMLEALADVRRRFPQVVYLIVGGGASWRGEGGVEEDLRRQTYALGLVDHVRFLGYRGDLLTVLHAADVLVSPSLREGMSVVLLDAMAAGLPIVATAVGGSPEAVVHGQTGLLVPPADPAALARAVCDVLGDDELRRRMGVAARQRAEELYDARVIAEQVHRLCEEVCAGNAR
jgi:glycosyltransferase involved in cell wall biosynthesis